MQFFQFSVWILLANHSNPDFSHWMLMGSFLPSSSVRSTPSMGSPLSSSLSLFISDFFLGRCAGHACSDSAPRWCAFSSLLLLQRLAWDMSVVSISLLEKEALMEGYRLEAARCRPTTMADIQLWRRSSSSLQSVVRPFVRPSCNSPVGCHCDFSIISPCSIADGLLGFLLYFSWPLLPMT